MTLYNNGMEVPASPNLFRDTLARTAVAPGSRFSPLVNERGIFNRTLSDGTLVHLSFANEGGSVGASGAIVGRLHIREGHNWEIYELHPDQRVWNFSKVDGESGQPQTSEHWLDPTEIETLQVRLADIRAELLDA